MISKQNKFKLYKWLFVWIRRKYKKAYLNIYFNDVKCENCKVWSSISSVDRQNTLIAQPYWGQSIECGQCGHIGHWNCVAFPFPASADANGNPIVDK